jgi:hypothetical protein
VDSSGSPALLGLIVEAREPSGEALHGSLKLGMEIDKGAQLISEPSERHFIFAAARLQLLDTPIGEVHTVPWLGSRTARESLPLCEGGLHQGTLLLQMYGRRPY